LKIEALAAYAVEKHGTKEYLYTYEAFSEGFQQNFADLYKKVPAVLRII
jgi:hypothetical protein